MNNDLRGTIERWKINAESFLKTNTQAFIVDINNTYYFCDIISVGEEKLYFKPFKGNSNGEDVELFWGNIIKFEEYKERER